MNWEWIKNGGVTDTVTVEAPPTLARPHDVSDGESEVRMSNHDELPSQ